MPERFCYSPQVQLDLDEIYDHFAIELNDPDKGQSVVADILSAADFEDGCEGPFDSFGII